MPPSVWTAERIELTLQLWRAGSSASQIAEVLGGVTRSAVLGKLHRLGVSNRGAPTVIVRSKRKEPRERPPRDPKPPAFAREAKPLIIPAMPPDSRPIQFPRATMTGCSWPLWIESTPADKRLCCGAPLNAKSGYCQTHYEIAHMPLPPRRRP
jgi:GcrA cell cycle regulator